MPLYAYKCTSCEHNLKLFHGMDENPGLCPQCSGETLQKQFLSSNIALNNKSDTGGAKQRVEKFIEETREMVALQKAEARKDYDP